MTDPLTITTHFEEKDINAMTPAKNTAAAVPAEPQEVSVDIMPKTTGLRLVEDGETGELTAEELLSHHVDLITANEQAAAGLREEAARFTAEADAHKAELRKLLTTGKHSVGNVVVTVTDPARSTDWAAFEKSYPVEANPALYKSVVNAAAVPPNLKEQFMVPGKGERKVSVK